MGKPSNEQKAALEQGAAIEESSEMAVSEKKTSIHEIFNKGERKIIFGGVDPKSQKVILPGHRAQVSHTDAEKLKALFPNEIELFEK